MATEEQLRVKGKYFKKKLKAKKVLRLYEDGERNFQGATLRGQSFKGQDLSEADFSEADIKSVDFSNANLTQCNFSNIKSGIVWHLKVFQIAVILIAASIFECSSIFVGAIPFLFLDKTQIAKSLTSDFQTNQILILLFVHLSIVITTGYFAFITISKKSNKYSYLLQRMAIICIFVFLISLLISSILTVISFLALAFFTSFDITKADIMTGFGNIFEFFVPYCLTILFIVLFYVPTLIFRLVIQTIIVSLSVSIGGYIIGCIVASLSILYPFVLLLIDDNTLLISNLVSGETSILVILFSIVITAIAGAYNGFNSAREKKHNDTEVRQIIVFSFTKNGTSFKYANLTEANFFKAKLKNTDFSKSNLTRVRFCGATIFQQNNFGETYLKDAQIREWVVEEGLDRNFYGKNLKGVNLQGTDLTNVSFQNADLNEADLSSTNLTGACIKDWSINSQTKLYNINCDYIYLCENEKERRPSDPSRNFEPGDFANLVQKALSTVDLIFSNGIDWQSFLQSFQNIQVEGTNGELTIQAIERKTGGALIVRVEVPPDADKAKIEASFWDKYNPLLEAKDREIKLLSQQTEFYSQQVEVIRIDNTRLLGIVETMAERETSKVNMTFNAPVTGVAGNVEGNQNIFSSQSIAQASTEIQNLLTTLQNNGLTQEQAERKAAQDLADAAENNPTALGKLVNWGKSLGNKAAETSESEVVRRVIKLALNIAGVPMP